VQGTEPTTDDRDIYTSCGYRLTTPFPDWQKDIDRWGREAAGGQRSYGRFNWVLCGYAPVRPSGAPATSGSPGPSSSPPVNPTTAPPPAPTPVPTPPKKP